MNPSKLLTLATASYREMVEKREWNGNKKSEALVYLKCNKDVHTTTDCPKNKSNQLSRGSKDNKGGCDQVSAHW